MGVVKTQTCEAGATLGSFYAQFDPLFNMNKVLFVFGTFCSPVIHFGKTLVLFIKGTVCIHETADYSSILSFLSYSFDFHQ